MLEITLATREYRLNAITWCSGFVENRIFRSILLSFSKKQMFTCWFFDGVVGHKL